MPSDEFFSKLTTVKPYYIASIGILKFGGITSLAIDPSLEFCQLNVDMYALLVKNSINIVLSGNSAYVSATLVDISGCFQFAKCSMNIRNDKTDSSLTGL